MSGVIERLKWGIGVELERPSNYGRRVTVSADDVLALISTLDTIQGMHHEKHGSTPRYEPDTGEYQPTGEPSHYEEYVICDYDKTPWPCRTQLELDPLTIRNSSTEGE